MRINFFKQLSRLSRARRHVKHSSLAGPAESIFGQKKKKNQPSFLYSTVACYAYSMRSLNAKWPGTEHYNYVRKSKSARKNGTKRFNSRETCHRKGRERFFLSNKYVLSCQRTKNTPKSGDVIREAAHRSNRGLHFFRRIS
jgi:hypothetical protein